MSVFSLFVIGSRPSSPTFDALSRHQVAMSNLSMNLRNGGLTRGTNGIKSPSFSMKLISAGRNGLKFSKKILTFDT